MELWFIYALLSTVGAGAFTFFFKVIAEQKLDGNFLTGIYFLFSIVCSLTVWALFGSNTENLRSVLPYAVLAGVLMSFLYVIQIRGLQYIDASLFYPLYKIIGPFLVLLAGLLWLTEDISRWEWVGIMLSFAVTALLIDRQEKGRQTNLIRGLVIVGACSVIAAIATLFQKIAVDIGTDIFLFIAIQNTAGLILNIFIACLTKQKKDIDYLSSRYWWYGLILGILQVSFGAFSLMALKLGPISIVYTVMSLYIVIPIILSIVIYKEHINLRKTIAIVLSLVAIIFFQI